MALTLIKEDGTGKVDANSYASAADGDAYHDGHLYASAWTAATLANKEKALVFATRLIDAEYQFAGWKANASQALQWPRVSCRDPDGGADLPSDAVPGAVRGAACELARELLIVDRTGAPAGEGLRYTVDGTTQVGYDRRDRRPIISHVAQAMLAKFGGLLRGRSGSVRLVRA